MLSKERRIRERRRVVEVLRNGTRTTTPSFIVMRLPGENHTRAAVVVSSKVSPRAVERNVIRRRVYAALAPLLPRISPPEDLVVITKPSARSKAAQEIEKELLGVCAPHSHAQQKHNSS